MIMIREVTLALQLKQVKITPVLAVVRALIIPNQIIMIMTHQITIMTI
jgi:hypothetical protein